MQACSPACAVRNQVPLRQSCTWRPAPTFCLPCATRKARKHSLTCCSTECEPTTALPNGLSVCYASKYDVDFLYREIFQEQVYMQHGIQLSAGSTVIDVGGNIGFFALFAAQQVGSHGTVITAEPIPDLHSKLQYNVHTHAQWCALHGISVADIQALPTGVGSGTENTKEFTYFPAAAGWSTMYADDHEVGAAMEVFLDNTLSGLQGLEKSPLTRLGQAMQNVAPDWLSRPVKRLFVQNMLNQKRHFTCQMTTVSEIVQQHDLHGIDLLKIDVERAELDVLMGIADQDWQRISQLVMEVHDIDGRLDVVSSLLRTKGKFDRIVLTQDQQLKGSTLYNMYCSRASPHTRADHAVNVQHEIAQK